MASASPDVLIKMQIIGSDPRPTESCTLKLGPSQVFPQGFGGSLYSPSFENIPLFQKLFKKDNFLKDYHKKEPQVNYNTIYIFCLCHLMLVYTFSTAGLQFVVGADGNRIS